MNDNDKQMLDVLIGDKGKKYRVVIDNDSVWVEDKENDREDIYSFQEFGDELLQQVLGHIGLDAEFC